MNYISLFVRAVFTISCIITACIARGEVLDSIEIQRRGSQAEISIRFSHEVQYLRHAPRDNGKLLSIFVQLTGYSLEDVTTADLVLSTRRSPPTDMVPPFTVTYPGPSGSILIEFDRPTQFSVLPGKDGRSITVVVPVLPGSSDWVAETSSGKPSTVEAPALKLKPTPAIAQQPAGSISPASPPPNVPLTPATPSISAPAPAASNVAQAKPTLPQLSISSSISARAAQAIEMIDVQRRGNEAEISVRFTNPIQYLRHTPADSGQLLRIFPRPAGGESRGVAVQNLRLPETDMVPRFTASYSDAENALTVAFDQPTRFTVRQGSDDRSISIVVPVLANAKDFSVQTQAGAAVAVVSSPSGATLAASSAAPPQSAVSVPAAANIAVPSPLSKEEVESQAKVFISAARQAIDRRNGAEAAARINQVLSLPPNSQTEAASALLGEAREFSGELRRATAEYEAYLKNYPNGEFVPHVKERLTNINKLVAEANVGQGLKPGTSPAAWTINGGISQYYFWGNSKIETITPPPPGQLLFNQDTLSLIDQKSLISNLDLSARRRDDATDTRIVFRGADTRNYLERQSSYNRLYAAYIEQTNRQVGYNFRAGRQQGSGGGVQTRFDGLSVGYNLNPSWKLNGVVGNPAEFRDPFRRSVVSASIDYTPQLGRPGFSAYYVEQTLEGVLDRQAVGTEIRYFDQNLTVFSLLDYDVRFEQVNTAMMQANLRTSGGTNYFATIDIRKSPPLSLTTALPGQISQDPFQPTLDFRSLFYTSMANLGVGQLRDAADNATANSSFYTLGFIHPFTPRWQLGADYRQSNISGTEANGSSPAQPGSGTSHVFSGQALGNGILRDNDSLNLVGSFIIAPLNTGQFYNVSYVVPINDWRFEGIVGYYFQTDDQGGRQSRWSPTTRIIYRLKNQVTLELNAGWEFSDVTSPLSEQHSRRFYLYGGYRWDFN